MWYHRLRAALARVASLEQEVANTVNENLVLEVRAAQAEQNAAQLQENLKVTPKHVLSIGRCPVQQSYQPL